MVLFNHNINYDYIFLNLGGSAILFSPDPGDTYKSGNTNIIFVDHQVGWQPINQQG